jgi:hypothetical protein
MLESWEVGKLGPVTHCVRARLGKSNSTASVRARQEDASYYSNAAGRCQKVEPGRVADGGDRGSAKLPTENGFVGMLCRKEES